MPTDDEIAGSLRERLRAILQTHGIALRRWAEDAGVSEATMRKFMAGESRSPRYDTLVKLAAALDMTIVDLLSDRQQVVTVRYRAMRDDWRAEPALPPGDRYAVMYARPDPSLIGVEVGDESCDRIAPPGAVLIVSLLPGMAVRDGSTVLVEHRADARAAGAAGVAEIRIMRLQRTQAGDIVLTAPATGRPARDDVIFLRRHDPGGLGERPAYLADPGEAIDYVPSRDDSATVLGVVVAILPPDTARMAAPMALSPAAVEGGPTVRRAELERLLADEDLPEADRRRVAQMLRDFDEIEKLARRFH